MLLKRVAAHLPAELAELVPSLESAGIKTTDNLIFTPVTHVASLTSIPTHLLDALTRHCLELTAPESVPGHEIVDQPGGWREFGLGGLDEVLGGWDGAGVMEICGGRRVGKSLLALHATLRYLVAEPAARATWIDTQGSFNASRAQKVLEELGATEVGAVLDRLEVTNVFRIEPDMFDVLDELRAEKQQNTRVIVIDTVSALFRDSLTSTTAQGHAAMVTLMELLGELTHSRGLTTMVLNVPVSSVPTNPLSSFSATTTKSSLGTAFTYAVDVSLFMQDTGKVFGMADEAERKRSLQPGVRAVVEVLKSRVSAAGNWAAFDTDGVRLLDVLPPPQHDERTDQLSRGVDTAPQSTHCVVLTRHPPTRNTLLARDREAKIAIAPAARAGTPFTHHHPRADLREQARHVGLIHHCQPPALLRQAASAPFTLNMHTSTPHPPHPPSPSPSSPISSVHSDDDSLLGDGDHPWTLVDDGTSVSSSLHSSFIGALSVSSGDIDDGRSESGRSVSSESALSHSSRDSLDLVDAGLHAGRLGDTSPGSLGASYIDAEASVSSLNTLSSLSMAGSHPLIMPNPLSAEASFVSSDGTVGGGGGGDDADADVDAESTPGQSLADLAGVPHVRDMRARPALSSRGRVDRAWLRESTLWAPVVNGVPYQMSELDNDELDGVDAVVEVTAEKAVEVGRTQLSRGDEQLDLLGSLPHLKEALGKSFSFTDLLDLGCQADETQESHKVDLSEKVSADETDQAHDTIRAKVASTALASKALGLPALSSSQASRATRRPASTKTYAVAVKTSPPPAQDGRKTERGRAGLATMLIGAAHANHMKRWSVVALASIAVAVLVKLGPAVYRAAGHPAASAASELSITAASSATTSAVPSASSANAIPDIKLIKHVLSTLKLDPPPSAPEAKLAAAGAVSIASAKLKSSMGQKFSSALATRPDTSLSIPPEPVMPPRQAKAMMRNASAEDKPQAIWHATQDDIDYVDASVIALQQYAASVLHVLHDVYESVYMPALQEVRREYARLADIASTLDLPTRSLLKRAVRGATVIHRRTAAATAYARGLYTRKVGQDKDALRSTAFDGRLTDHVESAMETIHKVMHRAARNLERIKQEGKGRLGLVAQDAHDRLGAVAHGAGQRVDAVVQDVGQRVDAVVQDVNQRVEGVVDGSIASVYQAKRGLNRLIRDADVAATADDKTGERVKRASRRRSGRKARRTETRRGAADAEAAHEKAKNAKQAAEAEAQAKKDEAKTVTRWLMDAAHHGALQLVL
ncbi:hypothetical protein Q5752_001356 [Cryptotrichosporon argae]